MRAIKKLEDLTQDAENANEGTLRGSQLLGRSMERYGAGRSIVTDENGLVIAGNKSLEAAVDRGLKVKVVQSDGRKLVVVQRTDLDMSEPAARELALLDNRAAEMGLKWNPKQLEDDLARGIELGGLFDEDERRALLDPLIVEDTDGVPVSLKTTLSFENDTDLQQFESFLAVLATRYPDAPTIAARLVLWATAQTEVIDVPA